MTDIRSFRKIILGAILVSHITVGTVSFNLFLNWYDTGQLQVTGKDMIPIVISGAISGVFGLLAIVIWLNKYQSLGHRPIVFFIQTILFSIVLVAFGFVISNMFYLFQSELQVLPSMIVALITVLFYLPMMIPFGTVVGIANGFLLYQFLAHDSV